MNKMRKSFGGGYADGNRIGYIDSLKGFAITSPIQNIYFTAYVT